ncbi:helix-turn-helix domain-containing protein [Cupriavidus oxalaticus]|jgi:predicted transcriptional regulator|uniref:Helix-turn-helix domain-containing protein n=2 Tax=Cupriavidus oxalaticus TaxID=96344 RepID=A0A375GMJ9_9BURK|nr:helix-turn-helix domain-containing protein [Cupriavidus oxalaticus]QEZ43196.1 transcriptional regulator [Cupriavidus oxalaticus]QRQ85418.1 helix-turn-helix domain-containing protein [Cupriavidus oxalaticus]QRQ90494.1 helix-turn-helix domain-containing protein [Cupriavidus oxalaticus]WQD85013.1 helix-turn-helix domain-containing protein [Cupriavidus oxalaticus]SPC08368.1 Transcriptional regulator [Cupriavidus oxalaticus]
MTRKLKIGIASLEDFRARTMAIARGELKPGKNEPKVWFQSLDVLAKVLSPANRHLLALIAEVNPESLDELSARTGRAVSNLSRTLRTMESYGLVHFEQGPRRKLAPRVDYSGIELELAFH